MGSTEALALVTVSASERTRAHTSGLEHRSVSINSLPSDHDIAACASAIKTIARETGFARRLEIGAVILDQLFVNWQEVRCIRKARGQSSFRRLADALDGTMSKSELYRCAMVCQLCRRLPFILTVPHITISHVEALDGLPLETQEKLLRETEARVWSVRQLRQARLALAPASARSEGRATSAAIRRITSLKQAVLHELEATTRALDTLGRREPAETHVATILAQVTALSAACSVCAKSSQLVVGSRS
jgi:hypothetical protein